MSNQDISNAINGINNVIGSLNNNPLTQDSNNIQSGFNVPATYSSDLNGLPYQQVPSNRQSQFSRNTVSWFVPQFGIVRMYINPASMSIRDNKLISSELTKGGYSLQYWGEALKTITIQGTTGSSFIEGINLLEQVYRAEQLAFDSTGLSLAANNSNIQSNLSSILGISTPSNTSLAGLAVTGLSNLLGISSNISIAPQNINSLAQAAFSVEMYFNGIVHRGFFNLFTVNEQASDFLVGYILEFTVTQTRGYRLNTFPYSRSANNGPVQDTTPYSYSGNVNS